MVHLGGMLNYHTPSLLFDAFKVTYWVYWENKLRQNQCRVLAALSPPLSQNNCSEKCLICCFNDYI